MCLLLCCYNECALANQQDDLTGSKVLGTVALIELFVLNKI